MNDEFYKSAGKWKKRLIFLIFFLPMFGLAHAVYSQTASLEISGIVMDEDYEPVAGATVSVADTDIQTVTSTDGRYSLTVPGGGKLKAYADGFIPYEATIREDKTTYHIQLSKSMVMDEVVVVGYGTQKKESVVGAIVSINASTLANTSKSQLSHTLAGNIPGIIAVQRSGEPGNDMTDFWIRGISTFAGTEYNKPLTLVDGVERDFTTIDPAEIESFSILKDASATAVYGVRGANGVIIITTKKGVPGNLKVNVTAEHSWKSPTILPEFVDAATYMNLVNMARRYAGLNEVYTADRIEKTINRVDPDLYPDVNWVGELVKSNTKHSRVNVNFTGGGPKYRYFISSSYHTEDGIYQTDNDRSWNSNIRLNQVNFRGNFDIDMTRTTTFSVYLGSQFQTVNSPRTSVDDIWRTIMLTPANDIPIRYSDGRLSTQLLGDGINPYNWLTQYGYKRGGDNVITSTAILSQNLGMLTKGLSLKGVFAYDVHTDKMLYGSYNPQLFHATGREIPDDPTSPLVGITYPGDDVVQYNFSTGMTYSTYLEASLLYNRTFGRHSVGGLLLYNQKQYNPREGINQLEFLPYEYQGLAGRLTYNYAKRYYLEFNAGLNGSENFAPGHRIGFFPAVAAGWLISQEPFWSGIKNVVPTFKIRGSYGTAGNDKIGENRFGYISEIWAGTGYNLGSPTTPNEVGGLVEGKIGVENLTWETELKRNIGVELSVYNFDLTFEYFNNNRRDILCERQILPGTAGFNQAPWANLGKMNNKGVDVSLGYRYMKSDWSISALGTFTFARNKITEWDEPTRQYENLRETGHRYGQQFGLIAEGLYTADDFDAQGNLNQELPVPQFIAQVQPGDIKYKDVNGDGIINTNDFTNIGYSEIPEIVYGFGVTATYKIVDVGIRFQGAANVTRLVNDEHVLPFVIKCNIHQQLAESIWTEENPSQDVFYPRLSYGYNNHNYVNSTWWQKDMSYLRIKDIVVGVTLPKRMTRKIGVEHLRIYCLANNMFTFSKFKLWDVELGSNSGMSYPIMKNISLGIELNF